MKLVKVAIETTWKIGKKAVIGTTCEIGKKVAIGTTCEISKKVAKFRKVTISSCICVKPILVWLCL